MITVLIPGHSYQVAAQTCSEIDEQLTSITEAVRSRMDAGNTMGLLVTRHGPASYTVEPNPSVPYGVTLERDAWELGGTPAGASASFLGASMR